MIHLNQQLVIVANKIYNEKLLLILTVLLLATSVILHRIPNYTLNDFHVLFILTVFLIIIKGLEKNGFISYIAVRFEQSGYVVPKLIILTAILAMFITNDIALLSIIPFTLSLNIDNKMDLVIVETLVANGASALTPFGNPQNLFLYFFYDIDFLAFVITMFPLLVFTLLMAFILLRKSLKFKGKEPLYMPVMKQKRESALYTAFFLIFIMSVLDILPLYVGVIPIVYAIIFDREALRIDWALLLIFVAFFGLTDNIISVLNLNINETITVFLVSALTSQIISNVPSALLFVDFTSNWKALLWGVSVGGFGNLIASLANLISYRLYVKKLDNRREYLMKFHKIGYMMFVTGMILFLALFMIG